jgi:hypothetical protein
MKIFISFLFTIFICFISGSLLSQTRFEYIPEKFLTHPELGLVTHNSPNHEVAYELIHERTAYTRTFLNKNGTKAKVQSSVPLHYLDENGFWLSRSYEIYETQNDFSYPKQQPEFIINKNSSETMIHSELGDFVMGKNRKIGFENSLGIINYTPLNQNPSWLKMDESIMLPNLIDGVDLLQNLYNGAIKTDFVIRNLSAHTNFEKMIIEEEILLPTGYSIVYEEIGGEQTNRLLVLNAAKQVAFIVHQPIITDSKEIDVKHRYQHTPTQGKYEILRLGETRFQLKLIIDGSWLLNNDRIFPLVVDPIVTIENTNIVNSCFSPNYQQAPLTVNVPAGETVFSTDISYDFVATSGSDAWMEDQRSFVVGPAGQTSVFEGSGSTAGTQTYNINNSEIGNGASNGSVTYTFNFARVWGGFGCNATFNFVNRRELTVFYGTLEFGDAAQHTCGLPQALDLLLALLALLAVLLALLAALRLATLRGAATLAGGANACIDALVQKASQDHGYQSVHRITSFLWALYKPDPRFPKG